jgi:membrane-bound serine protease (ClpP class)
MKKILLLTLITLTLWVSAPPAARAQDEAPTAVVITADGPVSAAMVEYLRRGIRVAAEQDAEVLIFRLETPGGSISLMDSMIQDILSSEVPVIVYVWPPGAIAGSAGTMITMAGHLSVMAPDTAIGAASPVGGSGEDLNETIETKVKEATKAQVRSLMEGRRPAEAIALAEATIEDAIAVTSMEALDVGMIDFIANDTQDLLQQADGLAVDVNGESRTLTTAGAMIQELPASIIEQLLAILTNPNILFILLSLGSWGIIIELRSPGGWVAGFIGVVSLTVALFGIGIIGANWLGLIFMAIAFVLFIMETTTPTMGALSIAGVISFIVGALVLFNSPGTPQVQQVSVPLVVITGSLFGLLFMAVVILAVRAQDRPVQTGQEGVMGRIGIARSTFSPDGIVQLGGEQWSARLTADSEPVQRGDRVEVIEAEGVRVQVRRVEPGASEQEDEKDYGFL